MKSGYGRIGKKYASPNALKYVPDDVVLIEAAMRRGQPLSKLIEPVAPSPSRIALQQWKDAVYYAQAIERPNRVPLYEVYDNIIIDNHLTSVLENRILKLQQTRFKVIDQVTKDEDEALTELLQREWFEEFLKHALESKFFGFSLLEIWDFNKENEIEGLELIDRKNVIQELGIVVKEIGDDHGWHFRDPQFANWYIPVGKTKDLGYLYKAAPNVLAKKFAQGAWGEYDEKIGIPFRWVETPYGDEVRMKQLGVIMQKMGSAGWAVLRENEKVEMLDKAQGDPTKCFNDLLKFLDSQVSKLILGQDGTTNQADNKGTYGSLQILQEVADDRHEADKTFAQNCINKLLFPRMLQYGYRLTGKLFMWDDGEELGIEQHVQAIDKISKHYLVDLEYIKDKTGIQVVGHRKGSTLKEEEDPKPKPKTGGRTGKKPEGADASVRIQALYDIACKRCTAESNVDAALFTAEIEKLIKQIWQRKIKTGYVDEAIVRKLAVMLIGAMEMSYGLSEADEGIELVDQEMIRNLRENIQLFSSFKSYQHVKEASQLLLDEEGKVRTFAQFRKAVAPLNENYFVNYLKAEYEHAIASAQEASQWVRFQANKDALPYLQYNTVKDERVRVQHRALEGVIRKVDDSFWHTYYPPNGWGCRCTVNQLQSGTETDLDQVVVPELPNLFKGNVGIDKKVYADNHPYFDVPAADRKKVVKKSKDIFKDDDA